MNLFAIEGSVMLVVMVGLLLVKGFAFVSALLYSAEAYSATGKLTKPAWVAILGLGLAAALIRLTSFFDLIGIAFLIAALVYLADVRPALAEVTTRR